MLRHCKRAYINSAPLSTDVVIGVLRIEFSAEAGMVQEPEPDEYMHPGMICASVLAGMATDVCSTNYILSSVSDAFGEEEQAVRVRPVACALAEPLQ
jgi:hypothetical protein